MEVVTLPRLGVTMTSATIVSWEKKVGDRVARGELLLVIESEKATIEIESPYEGVLRAILVEEESEALVGEPLAVIASAEEEIDVEAVRRRWEEERAEREAAAALPPGATAPAATAAATAGAADAAATASRPAAKAAGTAGPRTGVRASPRVRKLAQELGVDLASVTGSGPDGTVTERDVRAAAAGPAVKARVKLNQVRRAMASRMLSSWQTIPQFTQMATVSAEGLLRAKEAAEGVSINDLAVKAVADAAARNPEVNARFDGDAVIIYEDVTVSVAMATEQGLVVPVVRNADRKTAREIAAEIRELQGKAARGELSEEDLSGGTITVSNLGYYGVETGTPIINPPQSCMVFIGSIRKAAVVGENDEIRVAPVLEVSIAYDHRFIDGMTASRFTSAVKEELERAGGEDDAG